jgi:hypothetical protein
MVSSMALTKRDEAAAGVKLTALDREPREHRAHCRSMAEGRRRSRGLTQPLP